MAHIRDRGKNHDRRWQARYRDPEGREKSRTFTRKLDAQRWLDETTTDLVTGRYVDPRAGRTTVREFGEAWLAAQTWDASTHQNVTSRLNVHVFPHLGDVQLRHLRPSIIQAWVRGRADVSAPSHVRVVLTNLSSILAAAVEDGLIPTNPCASSAVATYARTPSSDPVDRGRGTGAHCCPPGSISSRPDGRCRMRTPPGRGVRSPT